MGSRETYLHTEGNNLVKGGTEMEEGRANWRSDRSACNSVQDTLPWNIAPNVAFEKTAETRRSSSPFSPEAVHRTLVWEVPSLYPEERNIFIIPEDAGKQKNFNKQVLLLSYQLTTIRLYPLCPIVLLQDHPLLHHTQHKKAQVSLSHWVFIPVSHKIHIQYIHTIFC